MAGGDEFALRIERNVLLRSGHRPLVRGGPLAHSGEGLLELPRRVAQRLRALAEVVESVVELLRRRLLALERLALIA